MGSSQSTRKEKSPVRDEAEIVRKLEEVFQRRREFIIEQLEAEKLEREQQQIWEKHWREANLREEKKRKEALLEWQRQQQQAQTNQTSQNTPEQSSPQQNIQQQRQTQWQHEIQRQIQQQQQLQQQQSQTRAVEESGTGPLGAEATNGKKKKKRKKTRAVGTQPPINQLSRLRVTVPSSSAVSPKVNPMPTDTGLPKLAEITASNIPFVEGTIADYVAEQNWIDKNLAIKIMKLLDDKNTVPFIARYRREITQGMDIKKLRKIKTSYDYARLVNRHAASVIKKIDAHGKCTPELQAFVQESRSLAELEYISSVYKAAKVTPAETARNADLGNLADALLKGQYVDPAVLNVNVDGLQNADQVKDRIVCIMADTISKDKRVFDTIKKVKSRYDITVETKHRVGLANEEIMEKYDSHKNFTSTEKNLAYDELYTIVRGVADKALNVTIIIPGQFDIAFKSNCLQLYKDAVNVSPLHKALITDAIQNMYNKSIKPFIRKRAKEEINEKAEMGDMQMVAEATKMIWSIPLLDDNRAALLSAGGPSIDRIDNMAKEHLQIYPKGDSAMRLHEAIMDAVSFIGVDVNNTSVTYLKRIPGLDEKKAKNIMEWRTLFGSFTNRNDLKKVRGIDSKTFEQCAGFIKIMPESAVRNDGVRVSPSSLNYLDQTSIHPESYNVAEAFLKDAKCHANQLGTKTFAFTVKLYASQSTATLAKKFGTTKETIETIIKGLMMEKEQILETVNDVTAASNSKTSFDDLTIGTVLIGVVRNVTQLGAFVDVGIGRDGLIIKRFMRGMTVSIGQQVETKVNSIEKDRRRFGLTLIKCL